MTDRTQGILNRASDAPKFSGVRWILGDGVLTNYMQSFVDDTMKRNAEFQSRAGVSPKIVRKSPTKCCPWCDALVGEYKYPDDVPDDVYHRHDNCNCIVEFYPGDGRKQSVWDSPNKWEPAEPEVLEERRKVFPRRATPEQLEARKMVGLNEGNATELPTKPKRPMRSDYTDLNEYDKARALYKAEREQYENALNEIVAKDIRRERKIKTFEDFEAWAKKNGVDVSELKDSGIDPLLYDDIATAETEMFERFPQVKQYKEELSKRYGNRKPWRIGVSDQPTVEFDAPIDGMQVGKKWGNYAQNARTVYDGMSEGYFIKGDGTIKTLIRHEYGHSVDQTIKGKLTDKYGITDALDNWKKHFKTESEYKKALNDYESAIRKYENELMELAKLNGTSEYSLTNTDELFAEGFAGYTSGGTSEFEKAFGKFLGRWL